MKLSEEELAALLERYTSAMVDHTHSMTALIDALTKDMQSPTIHELSLGERASHAELVAARERLMFALFGP